VLSRPGSSSFFTAFFFLPPLFSKPLLVFFPLEHGRGEQAVVSPPSPSSPRVLFILPSVVPHQTAVGFVSCVTLGPSVVVFFMFNLVCWSFFFPLRFLLVFSGRELYFFCSWTWFDCCLLPMTVKKSSPPPCRSPRGASCPWVGPPGFFPVRWSLAPNADRSAHHVFFLL